MLGHSKIYLITRNLREEDIDHLKDVLKKLGRTSQLKLLIHRNPSFCRRLIGIEIIHTIPASMGFPGMFDQCV